MKYHRDLVVLDPGPRRRGDLRRRFPADLPRALEAKQLSLGVLGLHDAVRKKCDRRAPGKRERGFHVDYVRHQAQRQPSLHFAFGAIQVGWQVSGVGDGDYSVGIEARVSPKCLLPGGIAP